MNYYKIGVTGHRHIPIQNYEQIKNEIKEHLSRLIEEKGKGGVIAVSPLAEGADQLFAESALELGLSLEVILPFQKEEYEKDFGKEAIGKFQRLMQQAEHLEILPPAKNRNEAYFQAGTRVLECSNELMAIWDFNKIDEIYAGTAHIIRQLFERFPEEKAIYAIHSPRFGEKPLITNGYMTLKDYQQKLIQMEDDR